MPRTCPVCLSRIEENERFLECSVCRRNYHLDHPCPQHPRANMLVISPRPTFGRPASNGASTERTTIIRPAQGSPAAAPGHRPRIPPPLVSPHRDYRKPVAVGSTLVLVMASLAFLALGGASLPFGRGDDDSTRSSGARIVERTATSREADLEESNAIATREARQALAERKFGPAAGGLTFDVDANVPATLASGVRLRDPMVSVRLFTPSAAGVPWDYGIAFRHTSDQREFRLIVTSDKEWVCELIEGDANEPVSRQSGTLVGVDTEPGEHNDLHLIVIGEVGYFFINSRYVATLDLGGKMESGDVTIGAGFLSEHQLPGQSTSFEDFEVAARGQS